MFVRVCVSPPRLSIGTGRRCCIAHWSNIQLTRVELSTPDAAIEITSEKVTTSTLPHLGFGARGVWKRRDRKIVGREEPRKTSGGQATTRSTTGQPVDGQKTRKLKSESVEESNRWKQSRQEPRNEERRENVR